MALISGGLGVSPDFKKKLTPFSCNLGQSVVVLIYFLKSFDGKIWNVFRINLRYGGVGVLS